MYPDIVIRLTRRFKKRQSTVNNKGCRKASAAVVKSSPHSPSKPKEDPIIISTEVTSELEKEDYPTLVSTGEALLVGPDRTYHLESAWQFPQVQDPNDVVIKVQAVGLNPIDWKSVEYNFCLPQLPWITGREASGVIESIGSAVTGVRVGQQVWTSTYYKDIRAGCFQERIVVPAHTVLPVSEISLEQAATLGVAGVTAAMVLWKWLGVSMQKTIFECDRHDSSMELANTKISSSPRSSRCLLIWGGSTITGQFMTQMAALSDVETISVCSAATEALSYSLGATHVVCRDDKSLEDIVEEVRAVAGDQIGLAVDLVGRETSAACLRAVSRTEPVRFAPLAAPPKGYEVTNNIETLNVEMKQFVLDSRNRIFAEELNRLVATRQVRCPEVKVLEGGLRVVQQGLDMVKEGRLGGRKAVVRM